MTRHVETAILGLAVLIASLFAGSGCERQPPGTTASVSGSQNLFQRVMAKKTIRCSFTTYAPYCIKNPNTGDMSGIFVDAVNEIGRRLDLKINWVEEVGYATVFEGLESGRYDMHGSGLWRNSTRGKHAYFSEPLLYNGIYVWARADDSRFKTLENLNSPDVRISVQDAAVEDLIAKTDFPRAQRVSIPQLNPWTENLLNIITDKADVTFAELGVVVPFLEKNPGTLKRLDIGRPIRVFPTSIPFLMGEDEFKSMIDSAIQEMHFDGTMEGILRKYETAPGEYLRVAPPYAMTVEGP